MNLLSALLDETKKAVYITITCVLLVSNFLSLSNAAFHDALYGILDVITPVRLLADSPTQRRVKSTARYDALERKHTAARAGGKNIAKKISTRTVRNISVNVSTVPGQSVPFLGAALVVAVTAMDINDACATLKDLREIENSFEIGEPEIEPEVCGLSVAASKEILGELVINPAEYAEISGGFDSLQKNLHDQPASSSSDAWDAIGGTLYHMTH